MPQKSDSVEVIPTLSNSVTDGPIGPDVDEKNLDSVEYEISPAEKDVELILESHDVSAIASDDMRARIMQHYGRKAEEDQLAPRADVSAMLEKIIEMTDEEAMDILVNAIEFHKDDPNFPGQPMDMMQLLIQGYKAAEMDPADWSFELRAQAAMIYWHSPYPEVRAVTDPFDDPTIPVETPRAYFLGLCFMAGATALNTFFSPRQPSIGIGANVLQLLLAPCGQFLGKFLPDWGFTVRGTRYTLNPGPWSYKEQMFATIIFTVANGAGGIYYIYIVQMMPQYLNQKWVTFGYEIVLALSTQFFGLGFAGLLRRFVIYPVTAIWPKVLPTLALNRTLVVPEQPGLVTNGWKLSRYQFFIGAFLLMFFYFWIPNSLFQALRSFNWMTWISPQNFTLGMITGFYGGMGFNPWATFDWNVSGQGSLVTPFFSQIQQYFARVLSGLIIIGMYWGNYVWSAYTPINSNEAFNNKGVVYNVTEVMGDHGFINIEKYKVYGPPYFSGANVFGQGAWFAWYPMTVLYVTITNWGSIKKSAKGMWRSLRHRTSAWEDNTDAHSRMMSKYNEVPDWWFLVILVISAALGIAGLKVWPTETPWWIIFPLIGLNFVFLIPSAILVAGANVSMGFNVLWQLLAGVWFAGNPEAQIIVTAFGQNFNSQADNYISDQKLAHYSKLPPRAVYRGQVLALFLNCFIFIGMLNWMVDNFNGGGTLCTWDNPQHFVCTDAVLYFASAVEYGAFGVRNMFKLYPILPWCFLMGVVIGLGWGLARKYASSIQERCRQTLQPEKYEQWNRLFFRPFSYLKWVNPAVTWAGALNWTGGNNLSYATNGVYISFIFMYWIKRRYTPWWQRYNYILEAAFGVGIAVSGTIQTFVFAFTNGGKGISIDWWGNSVATAGVDYQSYNQNATLLPIPDVGYFGVPPEEYPMSF